MNKHLVPYLAQTWNRMELIDEIKALSLDAAREICRANAIGNLTTRLMAEREIDYTEVFQRGECVRFGEFAQTTIVRG